MVEINRNLPVMVTGASGYLASWIVRYLLEQGCRVRGTIRRNCPRERIFHLEKMASVYQGQLELYEADLLRPSDFTPAMAGCELVIHTASPFTLRRVGNPGKELIDPALEGTRNVLLSVEETPSVKRVVMTSSTHAIYGDAREIEDLAGDSFTEDFWNLSSDLHHQPFAYSKTIAEKEAWIMANQQTRWDLVVLNPASILGPSTSRRIEGESARFMLSLLKGRWGYGAPALYFGLVDVRDVAIAHVKAGFSSAAKGRYILSNQTLSILDIARIIRKKYGHRFPVPRFQLPKAIMWLAAPWLGLTRRYVRNNAGYCILFNNEKSVQDLECSYRSEEETICDQVEQLLNDGLV